jgi:non-heme chloroperoxidase
MTTSNPVKREVRYPVTGANTLVGDAWGDPDAPPVVLLHGGGQTRHAWGGVGAILARNGFYALALDLRGHGDSSWDTSGDYRLESHAADLHCVVSTLARPPALVGASLGGMISLLYQGELYPGHVRAVVLVDITPNPDPKGVDRVIAFMKAHPDGFATLDDAANAVAGYLPHRPAPPSSRGLQKNLRRGSDGRWRWHWDPALIGSVERRRASNDRPERLLDAARALEVPTLLVRGSRSDVVTEAGAREFLDLVSHAEYVDVEDAAHMVAGDDNDAFADAIVTFLLRVLPDTGTSR